MLAPHATRFQLRNVCVAEDVVVDVVKAESSVSASGASDIYRSCENSIALTAWTYRHIVLINYMCRLSACKGHAQ